MNSTIVGLVAAIAVLSGGLGFSMTGVFDDQELMSTNVPVAGFLMGQVEIEAHNADGELFAYRLSDNEVVDDGEQCILKLLFATTTSGQQRGGYATEGTGACTGIYSCCVLDDVESISFVPLELCRNPFISNSFASCSILVRNFILCS